MTKHRFDIEDENESIRRSILRVSKLLGKTPTQKQYKTHRKSTELSLEQIIYRFGNWSNAVQHVGLKPNPFQQPPRSPELTKEELIEEFIRVANEAGKIPRSHSFRSKAKFSWRPYITKWGSWRNAVNFIIANHRDRLSFTIPSPTTKLQKKRRKNKLKISCPLLYEPENEYETIALFCLLAGELGFSIKRIRSDFPDALLIHDGREIEAEFEYLSSNYLQHCHPTDFRGLCICWRRDIDLEDIQIICLEEYLRDKKGKA